MFQSVTIKVADGTKPAQDYAPNRTYELTGTLGDGSALVTTEHVRVGIAKLKEAGDAFLGRAGTLAVQPGSPAAAAEVVGPAPKPEKPARGAAKSAGTQASDQSQKPSDTSMAASIVEPVGGATSASPSDDSAAVIAEKQAKLDTPLQDPAAVVVDDLPQAIVENPNPPMAELVSDQALNDAVAKKRGQLGEAGVPAIRALIEKFNPDTGKPGFVLRQISQLNRTPFLAQLAALKV